MKFFNVRFCPVWVLVVAVLVIIFREPMFFLEPRFWAEEAVVYFSYAMDHSWGEVFLHSELSYYSLWTNVATLLASRLVSLEYAPYITLGFSLMVQLFAIVVIIWSRSQLWDSWWTKLLAVSIVLFTLLSGEIWLNTINSQFYFVVVTVLLLFEPVEGISSKRKWFQRSLLLFAGLTGVLSCFLLPIFLLLAFMERKKERWIQALLLLGCSFLQGFIVMVELDGGVGLMQRLGGVDFSLLPYVLFVKTILLLVLGPMYTDSLLSFVNVSPSVIFLSGFSLIIVLGVFSLSLSWKHRILFIGSYFMVGILSFLTALGDTSEFLINSIHHQRYFYAPSVVVLLMVLASTRGWMERRQKIFSILSMAFLLVTVGIGIRYYRVTTIGDPDWPNWKHEVQEWRMGEKDHIETWPLGWKLILFRE